MIIYHEGLPGSGKSFAVFKDHVIPRLKEGRACLVYVEGVNHEQIAGLAEITVERCQELLRVITREQVPEIYKHAKKDDLVVIDEPQNVWPSGREKLRPEVIQFITEHRHLGLDIVLMGQVVGDTHSMWRGRIDRKIVFLNMGHVGMDTRYRWVAYKRLPSSGGRDKWSETGSGEGKYDPAYFGCYASHEPGVDVKENYKDDRFNIFKSRKFRLVIPLFFILALFGVWYAYGYLHGDHNAIMAKAREGHGNIIATPIAPPTAKDSPLATAPNSEPLRVNPDDAPADLIERLSKAFRLRLLGTYSVNGQPGNGLIEWRTADNALVNRLSFKEIESLGYTIFVNRESTMAYVAKGRVNAIALSWSLNDNAEREKQDTRLTAAPATRTDTSLTGEKFP